ncbi:MAG TPA: phosphoglycolate phosphatase [Steroidobacteraceae bacterium]
MSDACGPVRAVIFDLDGTLVDTAPDMVGALNELRAEHGLECVPFAHARSVVSHGAPALVRLGFGEPDAPRFEVLRERFLALYRARLAHETRLFPGNARVLDELARLGLCVGIVTNKPGWLTDPLLAALGLDRRVGCIVSGDTLPEKKPHPRPLLHCAAQLGVAPAQCVYVGDAERDVRAARAAGMRPLVAGYGYFTPADHPRSWPAEGWIDAPLELLAWLHPRLAPAPVAV